MSRGSMAASDLMYPTVGRYFLDAVRAKGPCSASEAVHRSVKEIYKKMTALCEPVLREHVTWSRDMGKSSAMIGATWASDIEIPSASEFEEIKQFWAESGAIILQSQPLTIGRPPGYWQKEQLEELEKNLDAQQGKILGADRTSNGKAVGAHHKLLHTAEQVKIILGCQRQQLRMDFALKEVQEAFMPVLALSSFHGIGASKSDAISMGMDQQCIIEHHAAECDISVSKLLGFETFPIF